MKKLLIPFVFGSLICAAHGQNAHMRVFGGYGWSGSIPNNTTGSTHLLGPEIGLDVPLAKLPMVEIDLRTDILLGGQLAHGSDLDGYVFRFFAEARVNVPGSKVAAFGGVGWGTGQARNHEFGSFNGAVMQLGLSVPLTSTPVGIVPSLEVAADLASKSGLSGYSVCLALKF